MKKSSLVVDYLLFIVLFALMFLQSAGVLQTIKYLLLLLTAYFLFKTTIRGREFKATHLYNYLFMGATVIYVLYGTWYQGPLFSNITLYFFVAAIVGFALAIAYKEKRKKLRAPKRPVVVEKKEIPKVAEKKVVKKATSKKTAKKKTSKKTAKKATKKTAKKKTSKKQATRGRPKKNVAKRVTTTYYQ